MKKQFSRLHTIIQAKLRMLTPTERKIASYLMEQTQEIALISVQELAARLKTGPASIMRVVHKLGYTGIAALKKELHQDIRSNKSPLVQFKSSLHHGLKSGLKEVKLIADQELQNIDATLTGLDEEMFAQAVRLLIDARHIYTLGVGMSSHLAGITAFLLRRIGLHADNIYHNGLPIIESLISLTKKDILIAFSLPPYSTQTIEAAIFAKAHRASVLGFTNRQLAPIAEHCTITLIAKTESRTPTNSLSALLLLVNGLTSAVAAKARPQSIKALEQTMESRSFRPSSYK